MNRYFVYCLLLMVPEMLYIGCASNNAPSNPGGNGPTSTFTVTNTSGSPTDTPTNTKTNTPTLNPTLGTATFTFTPPPPTSTPTNTETPLCSSPYSFGNTTPGASNSGFSMLSLYASHFNLPVAGKVIRLHVYCPNTVGPNIRMGLYTDSSGAPQSLISESSPQTSIVGWNTVDIPDTASLAAGTYWIALVSDGTLGLAYDNGSLGDTQYQSMAFGPMPVNFSGGSSTNWLFTYYADYCVDPGSPTPLPTSTPTHTPTSTPTNTATLTQTPVPSCQGNYSAGTNFPLLSTGVFNNYGSFFCSPITMTVTGRVTQLHFYAGAGGNNVQMALYTDNLGIPKTLLTSSNSQAAVSGVNTLDVPDTGDLAPGVYWIAVRPDSGSNVNLYNSNPGSGGYWANDGAGAFPSNISGGSDPGYVFSFYADYCVMSGSPTPANTPTWTYTPTATATNTPTSTPTPLPVCNPFSFGKNFVVSGTLSGVSGGILLATRYNMPAAGSVTALNVYIPSNAGTSIQMALYNNSGSNPTTLLTSSNPQVSVVGWNHLPVAPSGALAPGTYWICLVAQAGFDLSSDMTGSYGDGQYVYMTLGGAFPASYAGASLTDWAYCGYADYCVGAGTPTPLPTATWTYTPSFTPTFTPTITETPMCAGGPVTLGKTSIGANGGFSPGYLLATRYGLSTTGKTVTKLNFYVQSMPTPAATYGVRMGLYANNGSAPGTLISQSSVYSAHLGWNIVDIPDTGVLAAPATYWIALVHDNNLNSLDIRYDSTGLNDGYYGYATVPSPLPSTFPGGGGSVDWTFTFYGTTCP